ncbi:MAG: hypothetical protein J5I93_03305 [Pirellulaceae bacterium]|nr:hypothetical protein [Pirellulaceae bacterium]
MRLNELRCKNCGAPLAAENVVERLAMARCGHCQAVFALESATGAGGDASLAALRPKVEMPRGIQMQDLGSALEISRRWFTPVAFFMLFFCIFWNGFMVVWHTIALSQGIWFMSAFGLLHTAVGLGVLYWTLSLFLNTTYIRVGNGMIEVKTTPLPTWGGNKWLSADDLTQFYCHEQVSHNKNGTTRTYDILAVRRDNVREKLLTGLSDAEQALFIEQELERFLGIKDQRVEGEFRR